MNQEQVMGLIRQALPWAGGYLVTKGYFTAEQMNDLSGQVLVAAGAVMTLGSAAWSFRSKTDSAIVAKAIALPEVKRIETCATPEGVRLAESVPDPNVTAAMPPFYVPKDRVRPVDTKGPVSLNK